MHTDIEIFVIGQKNLANELLVCFLVKQLPDCRISRLEKFADFHHSTNLSSARQTLLLCDGKSFPADYFLERLHNFTLPQSCQIQCLFYNLERDRELEIELVKYGARGIVFTDDQPETLINAVNNVINGQLWASRQALSACLRINSEEPADHTERLSKKLTSRECQILRQIIDGSSNEAIAKKLCISRHTVKTHIYNIYRKINVSNRLKAARWAEQHLPVS